MTRLPLAVFGALAIVAALEAQDTPRFRSGVDVLPVDVTVVDGQGRPIRDLGLADFKVLVAGAPRRVLGAEWISLTGDASPSPIPTPEGYSSNAQATDGRLIVLAIDQPNIRFGGGRVITDAMVRFIDHLSPSDRVALVALGRGTASIPFTADHRRVKDAVTRINGQMQAPVQSPMAGVGMSLTTAVELTRGDPGLMERLLASCPLANGPLSANGTETCRVEITRQAEDLVQAATEERNATMRALAALLNGLKTIDAPKSLVMISEGLALFDSDGDATAQLATIGPLAAAARTTIYALRLGDQVFDAAGANRSESPAQDAQIRTRGLEQLTASARGTMFNVTTTGEAAFARIESELSGYYLLSVEASPADRERASAPLKVQVNRKDVIVRSRNTVAAPSAAADPANQSPLLAAASALMSPLTISALPLRVVSFSFQGSDASAVQLLIHADIGEGYTAPQEIAVAYMITDAAGRIVGTESMVERVAPRIPGVGSPLPFSGGASLPAGSYILKLAASDGVRIGTVEHPLQASLSRAGDRTLSDLTVGGPMPSSPLPVRPTVDDTVRFGVVHGYLEAYGAGAAQTLVRYEIATDEQSPALLTEDVAARRVNDSRASFSKMLSTRVLPPGSYRLRAVISVGGAPATTLSRAFDVARPDGGAASAMPAAAATAEARPVAALDAGTEMFLPIEAGDLATPFEAAEALGDETLRSFADRVPDAAKASFDEGVAYLRAGDYVSAESSFKRALRQDADFTAAVTYLAVTFAASGHDLEAAGAWQTALAGGGDLPQIYLWIGQALLRVRDFGHARSILEEAASRWPADSRFARPLAVLYATTGKGYDALVMLQKYLADHAADAAALSLGVEWIYQLHVAGMALGDPAGDLALARLWGDAYLRTNGPKQPLVQQWLDYLSQ